MKTDKMWWLIRILRLAVCMFLVISLNFILPRSMPGDPIRMLLGPEAVVLSQKDYHDLKAEYGLDRPLWQQYRDYWSKIAHGHLGYSYHHRLPVSQVIAEHLYRSLRLLIPAVLLSTLAAAILGTAAGWKAGSLTDLALTSGAILFYAMPAFLVAMVCLDIFAFRLGFFSIGGYMPDTGNKISFFDSMYESIRRLTLPIIVLTSGSTAAKFLLMRNSVFQAKTEDYVLYAKAKGIASWKIPYVHVFRNACLPLLNLVALHLGFVVSGVLLVEIVFSLNGMGILIYDAAMNRDYPVLQGSFLVLTLVVTGLNLLVDFISGFLDPRIRHGKEAL